MEALQPKIQYLSSALASLNELPGVKEVHQRGFIARIETADTGMATAVYIEAPRHGLVPRPIWNVIVTMSPLCTTTAQLGKAVEALYASISEVGGCGDACEKENAEEVTT